MDPNPVDVPATLGALQDQLDDLVAVVESQQRTIHALVQRLRDHVEVDA